MKRSVFKTIFKTIKSYLAVFSSPSCTVYFIGFSKIAFCCPLANNLQWSLTIYHLLVPSSAPLDVAPTKLSCYTQVAPGAAPHPPFRACSAVPLGSAGYLASSSASLVHLSWSELCPSLLSLDLPPPRALQFHLPVFPPLLPCLNSHNQVGIVSEV